MAEKRVRQLLQFLEQSPQDPFLIYALALEYVGQNQNAEAERLFRQLLAQAPDYLAVYYHYGKLLEGLERAEEAMALFRTGADLASKQGDAKTVRELKDALLNLELES